MSLEGTDEREDPRRPRTTVYVGYTITMVFNVEQKSWHGTVVKDDTVLYECFKWDTWVSGQSHCKSVVDLWRFNIDPIEYRKEYWKTKRYMPDHQPARPSGPDSYDYPHNYGGGK